MTGLSATWDGGAAYLSRTDEGGESTWRLEVHVDIWDRPQIQGATRPDQGRRLVYELTGLAQIHGAAISRVR